MSSSLILRTIRMCMPAVILGIWFGSAFPAPLPQNSIPPLTTEDLEEALERGDLSYDEYQELLALLDTESPDDSALTEAVQFSDVVWIQPAVLTVPSASKRSERHALASFKYQSYSALRGRLSPRQTLRIRSTQNAADIRADLARAGHGEWHANQALATIRWQQATLELGSIRPRWSGGLLIGPAPRFISAPASLGQSLLQPRRAGLAGANAHLKFNDLAIDVLYSRRTDSLLQHDVRGLRASHSFGALTISPAVLFQRLSDRTSDKEFAAHYSGVSGTYQPGTAATLAADIAVSRGAVAFQTLLTGRTIERIRWRFELWSIPEEYRNPIMYARAQPDRELIFFAEIDRTISNTSAGERGGELNIRMGPTDATTTLLLAWWRERPHIQSASRVSIVSSRSVKNSRLTIAFALRNRPSPSGMESSHQGRVRLQTKHLWVMATCRVAHQSIVHTTRSSGQFRAGYEGRGYGLGELSFSAALDYYDFNTPGFVTLRYAQSLALQTGQMLGLYLRWRSPNERSPAVLSLRVKTEISI